MSRSAVKGYIGLVGVGIMGSNLAMLFAEHGYSVSCWDVKDDNVRTTEREAQEQGKGQGWSLRGFTGLKEMVESLPNDSPRQLLLSISHGKPVDEVLEQLKPLLRPGDIILDGGNEVS